MTTSGLDAPRLLRHAGDVLGVGAVVIFVLATFACWGQTGRHLAIAGRPAIDLDTLIFIIRDGTLPIRAAHWLAAWAWGVAAGGAAIMSIAGARWLVVRSIDILAERRR